MKKIINVAMAILQYEGKILIAQRKKGQNQELLWEFPGGKIEDGETPQNCLKREFQEEFEKDMHVNDFFMEHTHMYEDGRNIRLIAYFASCKDDKIPAMHAHESVKFVDLKKIPKYSLCPADIPFLQQLVKK